MQYTVIRYRIVMAFRSFANKDTEDFFYVGRLRKGIGWASVKKIVSRKLDLIHYAARLEDLKSPPGNRLEALKGDLSGYHSIRVNDQWRVIFKWAASGPFEVQVVDYH